MSASPTTETLRPAIATIAESVFSTMLELSIHPLPHASASDVSAMTAAVYYVGAWNGALLLECSLDQAMAWGSHLMDIPAPITREDARDSLGELCNVLAGNLKPMLPPGVALSAPSVVAGADYSLSLCGAALCESMRFGSADGPFQVALVIL
jgi:chemotaxis protein CheX